tara:strand:- start:234 stop:845 length:612 start_codon:yes stop_codon:yes gene_type:complete
MRILKTTYVLILVFLCFTANAQDYSFGSIGYTKHIAADPHDSQGNTYYNDPEENGLVFGYGAGSKSDGFGSDVEINFYSEVSNKISSDGQKANVSTATLISNFYFMPDLGGSSLMIGGGLGGAFTVVDTSYSSGGVTFNGDETNFTPAFQALIGLDFGDIQIVYKISNFGEVKGGSGTASNGSTYVADEFDNNYQSIDIRFKF